MFAGVLVFRSSVELRVLDEMRWCAYCRAARQAFVNEELSKQLLCSYLWNEILQTHTQKPVN